MASICPNSDVSVQNMCSAVPALPNSFRITRTALKPLHRRAD